jgi:hypothetical protein
VGRVEAHRGGEFGQQSGDGTGLSLATPGAQHDYRGVAPGQGQRGVVEARQPWLQGGVQATLIVAAHGHQLPAGGEFFHLHRGVLEFGLARNRIVAGRVRALTPRPDMKRPPQCIGT